MRETNHDGKKNVNFFSTGCDCRCLVELYYYNSSVALKRYNINNNFCYSALSAFSRLATKDPASKTTCFQKALC